MEEQDNTQRRLEVALELLRAERENPEQSSLPAASGAELLDQPDNSYADEFDLQLAADENYSTQTGAYIGEPFDEDDEIPAFLQEERYQGEVPAGRSMTGILFGVTGLAAVTVFGSIVLYNSKIVDFGFLESNIVGGSVTEARATEVSGKSFNNNSRTNIAETAGNMKSSEVVANSNKLWQEKLVPQQNGQDAKVVSTSSARAEFGASTSIADVGGNSFNPAEKVAALAGRISTKPSDLPIDEVPQEGADATINDLENSLSGLTNGTPVAGGQGRATKLVAQAATTTEVVDPKLKALTDQVVNALSDLGGENGNAAIPLTDSVDRLRSSLASLVMEATSQGKSTENVELLIKEAIGGSSNNLPDALKNKDGSLDITSLLTSVVNRAKRVRPASSGESSYLSAIEEEGNGTAITADQANIRYITVKRGDTLSSISFAVYGDSLEYPRIYKANRNLIRNPNVLSIGIQLQIP